MELDQFWSARVVIVAGKGGVGKTTVTAAMATAAARAGMSVLIVEVEGKSGLTSAFGRPSLVYEETELAPGVRARTLTPDEALVDYLQGSGMRRISGRLARSGALDVVATAVPGMQDILVLGKVKQLERERRADLVLVDAPAAGHAVTFLTSAQGLLDAVRVGPVRRQAADVVELLHDPARCQVMLVTVPEETPVNELVETAFSVEDRAGVALGPVVVNGVYPEFSGSFPSDPSTDQIRKDAEVLDVFVSDREAEHLVAAAGFRAERESLQRRQIERLAARLPLPQVELPFVFTADVGPEALDVLAEALTDQIEALS